MRLTEAFPGEAIPFEGDRTVLIRRLPAGAQVQSARVTVAPVAAPGRDLFTEVLSFPSVGREGDFGMTKVAHPGANTTPGFVEVDFHARRTLAVVGGVNVPNSTLQVDLGGGVFMAINDRGVLSAPEDDTAYAVQADGVVPGLTAQKFRLRGADTTAQSPDVNRVTVRTVPTNLSLALGELAPFWTRTGEMTQPEVSNDFAEFLQLFLNDAEVKDGYYNIPIVIHSDAIARVNVAVELEYVVQQSALPPGVSDVALPYTHDTTAQAGSATIVVALPLGAEVTDAGVRIVGSFESSRIAVGPTGPIEPTAEAAITPDRGQAQPLFLSEAVSATAVDLLLSCVSQAAVLDLNVLGDVDGKPFGDPLLAEPVPIELDQNLAASPTWLSARLPETYQFPVGKRVWLALQAREGEAVWHAVAVAGAVAEADRIGLHYSTSSGLAWRATIGEGLNGTDDGRLAGLFRLRHVPDEYQMPIEALVGEGDAAVRVSLERYRALGRIDFTIDFPEFVAAINQAARHSQLVCPSGEQLRNGDFVRWLTVGDQIGRPQVVDDITVAQSVTVAPNGEWIYIGSELISTGTFYHLPLHSHLPAAPYFIQPSRQRVVASHDSKRLYILTGLDSGAHTLAIIDTETRIPMGGLEHRLNMQPSGYCLALSINGRYLYVGGFSEGNVQVLDTSLLEGQLLNNDTSNADVGPALITTLLLSADAAGNTMLPRCMRVSLDGQRLFVVAEPINDNEEVAENGRLYIFDTGTFQELAESPLDLDRGPSDLALTPNGMWALVSNAGDDSVTLVDVKRLSVDGSLSPLQLPKPQDTSLRPMAVEISPNGRYAFVANADHSSVSIIDLTTWQVREPIIIGQSETNTIDIAITPSGDKLYVGLGNDLYNASGTLYYLPLGRQFPEDWTLTQGFVQPLAHGAPHHLTAYLGPLTEDEKAARPARPSSLSQVVAAGECTYEFSFWGIATVRGATAEIIWRGDGCNQQRIDSIPIHVMELRDKEEPDIFGELFLHRERLQAPPGTTQAEIRFIVPPNENAVVDTVAMLATAEAVSNSDLLDENEDKEIIGWQVLPATATGFMVVPDEAGTQLANMGGEPVTLLQSFEVTAAQSFVLLFDGEDVGPMAHAPARVELHWRDATETPTGAITTLTVATGESEHRFQGTVPENAASVELHLVITANATLLARRISFVPVELLTVPISFVAQAPGDITVLGFDYDFDLADSRPAPVPPEGLCAPTPPGRRTDGGSGCVCPWCPTPCGPCEDEEKGETAPTPPVAGSMRSARQVRRASRAVQVTPRPFAGTPERRAAPPIRGVETSVAEMMGRLDTLAGRAPDLVIESTPLTVISGIAEKRAVALADMGIVSLSQLAAADSAAIAGTLSGVDVGKAEKFVADARALLDNPGTLPAPLVSCLMPTFNRRPFAAQAIAYFLRQDYPNRELIILDDGDDPIEDLVSNDKRIRYIRLAVRSTIGQKHNRGCLEARGPIIAHWDDDVWMADWRLSYQVAALIANEADLCGLDNWLKYDPRVGRAWHVVRPPGYEPWIPGGTSCYRKSFWQARSFDEQRPVDSDIEFLRRRPEAKIVTLAAINWLVDIIHGANSSPQNPRSPLWHPFPTEEIQRILGDDWEFYQQLARVLPVPA